MAGLGVGMWGASLAFTDVVRAILLFYLMPVWSITIECIFMGRKLNLRSAAAIAASLFGIVLICRGEVPLEGLGALGDWMALVAGIFWAGGAATLFKAKKPELSLVAISTITGALISGGVGVLILSNTQTEILTLVNGLSALGLGLIYFIPLLCITLWGVTQLPPAMASFVLTFEVVVGVVTSAMFLDQPFGWFEIGGATFIITGAMLEVLSAQRQVQNQAQKQQDIEA